MAKKNSSDTLLITFIVLLSIGLGITGLVFSLASPGFSIYDDFSVGSLDPEKWQKSCVPDCDGGADIFFDGNGARLHAHSDIKLAAFAGDVSLAALQDFYGYDIRILYDVQRNPDVVCRGDRWAEFDIGACPTINIADEGPGIIEVTTDYPIDPDRLEVEINGVERCDVNIPLGQTRPSFRAYASPDTDDFCEVDFTIKRIEFRVPFECEIPEGHTLAFQTFTGQTQVSLADLDNGLRSFCYDHPAYIIEETRSTSRNNVYQALGEGDVLTVPNGQQWIIFYVAELPPGDVACTGATVYSFDAGGCVDFTSFDEALCLEGFSYDPIDDECVKIVDSRIECTEGEYREETDECVVRPNVVTEILSMQIILLIAGALVVVTLIIVLLIKRRKS